MKVLKKISLTGKLKFWSTLIPEKNNRKLHIFITYFVKILCHVKG